MTTANAKLFLRVDHSSDDTLIASLVKAASETGESLSRLAFITQTLEMTIDEWPEDSLLELWRPPLQSVTSVKYLNESAVESTWTDYTVDIKNRPGKIIFHSFPSAALLESGAITVRYVAGYGSDDASVPEQIKQTVLQLVAYWYEGRGIGDVPNGIANQFVGERVMWF